MTAMMQQQAGQLLVPLDSLWASCDVRMEHRHSIAAWCCVPSPASVAKLNHSKLSSIVKSATKSKACRYTGAPELARLSPCQCLGTMHMHACMRSHRGYLAGHIGTHTESNLGIHCWVVCRDQQEQQQHKAVRPTTQHIAMQRYIATSFASIPALM